MPEGHPGGFVQGRRAVALIAQCVDAEREGDRRSGVLRADATDAQRGRSVVATGSTDADRSAGDSFDGSTKR